MTQHPHRGDNSVIWLNPAFIPYRNNIRIYPDRFLSLQFFISNVQGATSFFGQMSQPEVVAPSDWNAYTMMLRKRSVLKQRSKVYAV